MKIWQIVIAVLCFGVSFPALAQEYPSSAGKLKVTTLVKGLEHPWSLEFLPDGRVLLTERPGRMRLLSKEGKLGPPLAGVPPVFAEGQGGLLDVALDPQFSTNQRIYFSYAEEKDGKAGTAVARARLADTALEDVKVIFRQQPKVKGPNHWGSRLVFGKDGMLFITLGERFDHSEKAQDLSTHLGKVVRVDIDGKAPPDNPFMGKPGALPEIWSYGHRNVQGAVLHPETGQLWTAEHGPRGGDEINLTEAGKNYGWPKASYGSHYTMIPIPDDHAGQGFVEPLFKWNPSVSPSGMMFYTGARFKAWKGDLFTGALNGTALIHLSIKDNKIIREERLLEKMGERIRDVKQGPDGWIYFVTDSSDGRVMRLEQAP